MDKHLYIKFVKFLNHEANRYISSGNISEDELSYFLRELNSFKMKVSNSKLPDTLKTSANKLNIEIPKENREGNLLQLFLFFLKRPSIFSLFISSNKDKEIIIESFQKFKLDLQNLLLEFDNEFGVEITADNNS